MFYIHTEKFHSRGLLRKCIKNYFKVWKKCLNVARTRIQRTIFIVICEGPRKTSRFLNHTFVPRYACLVDNKKYLHISDVTEIKNARKTEIFNNCRICEPMNSNKNEKLTCFFFFITNLKIKKKKKNSIKNCRKWSGSKNFLENCVNYWLIFSLDFLQYSSSLAESPDNFVSSSISL